MQLTEVPGATLRIALNNLSNPYTGICGGSSLEAPAFAFRSFPEIHDAFQSWPAEVCASKPGESTELPASADRLKG